MLYRYSMFVESDQSLFGRVDCLCDPMVLLLVYNM